MSYDEACLILVHAIFMQVLEMTGTQSMMANAVSHNLEAVGFPREKGAKILEGAFRRLQLVDEASEFLSFVATDESEGH